MEKELVVVIDFGGQYNQLVARRVRECNVYCEIYSYKTDLNKIKAMNPKGIILTGGPASCYEPGAATCSEDLFHLGVPVLGLCYGAQLMTHVLGGKVERAAVREYLKSYQGQPPTLKDLYDDLMKQVNPEAHRIALALELFTVGSLNVFSHQTNINTKSRILCFDIQDLGENLKSVGLLVMLDAIYNRVIQNRREGKYTHVYIDEIYLFFANGSGSGRSITNYSSEFLYKCWKRFRKYGATLTGITQNVEECLLSNTARMMFANSEFLLMLNQATTDREQLARLLGASDTQMSYVDNAPAGHGLIKVGGAIVPFANELPKNTELYRLMSTRPGED